MKVWEWERLRDAYRVQRDKAAAEHRRADYEFYTQMFEWACMEIAHENGRRYEQMSKIAMLGA